MKPKFNKIFIFFLFIFFIQLHLISYSKDIEKTILNNILIKEYDNNNISIKINSNNPLKNYEIKQHNDITIIILPLTNISSNFQVQKCNCNNLVKNIEIQYIPYLNKNTKIYGYTKIKLYTNPDIQVMLEFNTYNKPSSSHSSEETTFVKNYVTNLKKNSKKFKSSTIMPIIKNISSIENSKFNIEDRRNNDDLNWNEKKLIEYKNSPIKFPITKKIKFFILKNIFTLFICFMLILILIIFFVFVIKKKDWKVK